jgi:hypothetical protein
MRSNKHAARLAAIACVLIVMLCGARGFSQSPAQQSPSKPQQPPAAKDAPQPNALRVTSRLVQVSVTVQDKDGHSVTDLTKDDFEIFDQGQRQQIATFAEQRAC